MALKRILFCSRVCSELDSSAGEPGPRRVCAVCCGCSLPLGFKVAKKIVISDDFSSETLFDNTDYSLRAGLHRIFTSDQPTLATHLGLDYTGY